MGQIYNMPYKPNPTAADAINEGIAIWRYIDAGTGRTYITRIIADIQGVVLAPVAYENPYGFSVLTGIPEKSFSVLLVNELEDKSSFVSETKSSSTREFLPGWQVVTFSTGNTNSANALLDLYPDVQSGWDALGASYKNITYRLTNCTAPSAPTEAPSGSTVIVPLVFSEGFGIVNNSDLYVMKDGVLVTSLWNPNDKTLSFTMP